MSDFNTEDRLLRNLSDAARALEETNSEGEPIDLVDILSQSQDRRKAISHFQECVDECRAAGISGSLICGAAGIDPINTDPDKQE